MSQFDPNQPSTMPGRLRRRLARHSRSLEAIEDRISRELGLAHPIRLCLLDESSAAYLTARDRERLERETS
jgi:hypothetical protein